MRLITIISEAAAQNEKPNQEELRPIQRYRGKTEQV